MDIIKSKDNDENGWQNPSGVNWMCMVCGPKVKFENTSPVSPIQWSYNK